MTGISFEGSRIAVHNRKRRDILGHNTPRSHNGVVTDPDPAHNDRVTADRPPFAHERLFQHPIFFLAARMPIVDKSGIRTNKNTVADSDPIEDGHMMFDGHVIANDRAAFDKTAVANVAATPDHRAGLDIRKGP